MKAYFSLFMYLRSAAPCVPILACPGRPVKTGPMGPVCLRRSPLPRQDSRVSTGWLDMEYTPDLHPDPISLKNRITLDDVLNGVPMSPADLATRPSRSCSTSPAPTPAPPGQALPAPQLPPTPRPRAACSTTTASAWPTRPRGATMPIWAALPPSWRPPVCLHISLPICPPTRRAGPA